MNPSARRTSPAAERNRQPLLEVLQRVLPPSGRALEIASGTGQHVAWFARHLPGWTWQPTDADPAQFESIAAWCEADEPGAGLPVARIEPPRRLDVRDAPWGVAGRFDAVLCANLLHISPADCCGALMRGTAAVLAPAGVLVVYGPFVVEGEPTAPSNLAFDADLRRRDPAWGLRRLGEVTAQAETAGLRLRERVAMPAHNLVLIFEESP